MSKRSKYIVILFAFLILSVSILPTRAFAYVDPGLGGLLFQIGYIVFTSLMVAITFWLKPIKRFFQRKKNTDPQKEKDE